MEEKKYTADGMNIEVDKYEDKKIRERRIMAYAFKMIREESGMNRKDFAGGSEFHTGQCRNGN